VTLPLGRATRPVYRAHHPMWAFDPGSGEGARIRGGRFNRPGIAALYTSMSPETAWLEAQQGFAFKAQPMTVCAYDVECEGVLDLTTDAGRVSAGTSLAELGSAWEDLATAGKPVPTWLLAERLIGSGCAGIIVPSFAARATARDANLVFWKWAAVTPHKVVVIDDERRLPINQDSWKSPSAT
jgi:RES domain-containing protein